MIEAPASMWLVAHYIDDLVPYAPLELCSYWGCGQVFHFQCVNEVCSNWHSNYDLGKHYKLQLPLLTHRMTTVTLVPVSRVEIKWGSVIYDSNTYNMHTLSTIAYLNA